MAWKIIEKIRKLFSTTNASGDLVCMQDANGKWYCYEPQAGGGYLKVGGPFNTKGECEQSL